MAKKECYGKFYEDPINAKEKGCNVCNDNLDCIVATRSCGIGTIWSRLHCGNDCNFTMDTICRTMNIISQKREKYNCINFGKPKKNPLEKCTICDWDTMQECEIFEFWARNLKRANISSVIEFRDTEVNGMRTDESDTCFEHFRTDHDDTCWKDCEYVLRCLRHAEVSPNGLCYKFPVPIEDQELNSFCTEDTCLFRKTCETTCDKKGGEFKAEIERKKLFTNFYTIGQLREEFMYEEN
jgi:hypothetical protein